jgi:predicted nucleic acid-binding protein
LDENLPIGQTIYERAVMLDTGPLISLFDPKDNRGEQVRLILQGVQVQKYPVCITQLTIAEAHRRLLYDIGHQQALNFLEAITDGSINILDVGQGDIFDALGIVRRYFDQRITFTDAINMAVMKRVGIHKALSYDFHFQLLNFSLLP